MIFTSENGEFKVIGFSISRYMVQQVTINCSLQKGTSHFDI